MAVCSTVAVFIVSINYNYMCHNGFNFEKINANTCDTRVVSSKKNWPLTDWRARVQQTMWPESPVAVTVTIIKNENRINSSRFFSHYLVFTNTIQNIFNLNRNEYK